MKDFISGLIIAALFTGFGMYLGVKYQKSQEKKAVGFNTYFAQSVEGTSDIPDPIESIPKTPELPVLRDTIYLPGNTVTISIMERVDSAAIIADYIIKREYTIPVYDANYGSLTAKAIVQYNRLTKFDYKSTPVVKEIILKEPIRIRPFAEAGINSFGQGRISLGAIKENWGFGTGYVKDFVNDRSGVEISGKYIF